MGTASRGGGNYKKTLAIMVLSGLLALPLSRCKKTDELSDTEVNEIFITLCRVFNDALSQANSSATASVRNQAEKQQIGFACKPVAFCPVLIF